MNSVGANNCASQPSLEVVAKKPRHIVDEYCLCQHCHRDVLCSLVSPRCRPSGTCPTVWFTALTRTQVCEEARKDVARAAAAAAAMWHHHRRCRRHRCTAVTTQFAVLSVVMTSRDLWPPSRVSSCRPRVWRQLRRCPCLSGGCESNTSALALCYNFCRAASMLNSLIATLKPQSNGLWYSDWYTARWSVGCYIWYSEEGTGRGPSPLRPLLTVPNITAHPSTASVPTSYYSM